MKRLFPSFFKKKWTWVNSVLPPFDGAQDGLWAKPAFLQIPYLEKIYRRHLNATPLSQ